MTATDRAATGNDDAAAAGRRVATTELAAEPDRTATTVRPAAADRSSATDRAAATDHSSTATTTRRIPRVLSIAGTDPTGGAGIHADLKSIAANGGYGMAAVTALVAQNTHGVRSVHVPPASFLTEQLDAVSDDVTIDAVKIGMLGTAEVIAAVRDWLEAVRPPLVVLDPVMVATSGDRLLDADAEAALRDLAALADLITPNLPELAILADEPEADAWEAALAQAGRVSAALGVRVLAKGGHLPGSHLPCPGLAGGPLPGQHLPDPDPAGGPLPGTCLPGTHLPGNDRPANHLPGPDPAGDPLPDALVDARAGEPRIVEFPGERVATRNTHGTGCSLSAALATRIAQTGEWPSAIRDVKRWLTESLRHADALQVGSGHGPISHFAGLWARGGTISAPSAGEIAADWWERIAELRTGIDALPFVVDLGAGTLDRDAFTWYLEQDALYLRDYARALAAASAIAPTREEQAFWAASAEGAIVGELQLHEQWLGGAVVGGTAGAGTRAAPATTAYLDHLLAASARGDYAVLAAALLPCFWLYQDVGERLHEQSYDAHPYRSWLDTYADPAFAAATARAIEVVTAAAARTDAATREAMFEAFRISAAHELAFFAAPLEADLPSR